MMRSLHCILSIWWLAHRAEGVRRLQHVDISSFTPTSSFEGLLLERNITDTATTTRRHRRLDGYYTLPSSPEDHRVEKLPLLDDSLATDLQHYAGHLPASTEDDKYFFYWLFYPDPVAAAKTDASNIPLIIWLNGGPGCSSMDGLFLEHGPIRFSTTADGNTVLTRNEYSWHKAPAYVVYVDQPVGTGLSFTKSKTYPSNDEKVNIDFYHWLNQFLNLHADVFLTDDRSTTQRPIYFTGESHAGHYIPSMMAYILEQNEKSPSTTIQLSGAAIGNGWVDPFHQYAAAGAAFGHGLIGMAQMNALQTKEVECQTRLTKNQYRTPICFDLLDSIVAESQGGTTANYKVSQYDVRKWESRHGSRSFPPGHKIVESYLGGWSGHDLHVDKETVLEAIHASAATTFGQQYRECTDPPWNALSHQDGLGVVPEVVRLLEKKVSLLFFNGIMDLICNHVGNEVLLEKLPWTYREEWNMAPRYSWAHKAGGEPSGYMKEYKNLKYLKVLNSGHMVPLDVPEVALDMVKTFVYGGSFESNQQKLDRSLASKEACEPCPTCEAPSSESGTSAAGTSSTEDGAMFKYVIAHSWLGAILAVSFFLVVLVWVRRRQERSGGSVRHQRMTSDSSFSLELKEQYRDDPGAENGTTQAGGMYEESDNSSRASASVI